MFQIQRRQFDKRSMVGWMTIKGDSNWLNEYKMRALIGWMSIKGDL